MQKAQAYMRYLVNESLLKKLENNLDNYDKLKIKNDEMVVSTSYPRFDIRGDIISLYNKDITLNELLNDKNSLNNIIYINYGGIKI